MHANTTAVKRPNRNPNCFFDNFETADESNAVAKTIKFDAGNRRLTISGSEFESAFPSSGFYQLRARCVDEQGRMIGACSDVVTLRVTR